MLHPGDSDLNLSNQSVLLDGGLYGCQDEIPLSFTAAFLISVLPWKTTEHHRGRNVWKENNNEATGWVQKGTHRTKPYSKKEHTTKHHTFSFK